MRLSKFLFLFLFLFLTSTVFAQSSSELKRRKASLNHEIAVLNKSLKKTSANKKLSLRQVNLIVTKIRLREEKINTINSEIKLLDNTIHNDVETVHTLQSRLNKLKKEYAAMVLFAYRNQSVYSKLMFIFAAKDFNQAYMRLKYLQQFSKYRKKQVDYINHTQRSLKQRITELNNNKKSKNELLQDQEQEKTVLAKEKLNKSKALKSFSRREKTLKQQLLTKKKEAARLNRAIQAAISREIEAARKREAAHTGTSSKGSSTVLKATPEAARLSAGFLSNHGKLPWPVANGIVVEGFGKHKYGINVTTENNGIDIKTAKGATVRAVFTGVVSTVTRLGSMYVILIRHGEYFSVYSNLKNATVSRGQKVTVKQSIGTVITEASDGTTQLHFEIRKGASPVNPTYWLAR